MKYRHLIYFFGLMFVAHSNATSPYQLHAAVGMGLKDGLHAKYLTYIASELGYDISISEMPFTRRVQSTANGKVDLLIGLHDENLEYARPAYKSAYFKQLIYVEPPYEQLNYKVFSLIEHTEQLQKLHQFENKLVGVSEHASHFPELDQATRIIKVEAQNLDQKIDWLLHKRITAFVHLDSITQRVLKKRNLADKISYTAFQPDYQHDYFVVISKSSILYRLHRAELKKIITKAIDQGIFKTMRLQHYQNDDAIGINAAAH